MPKSYFPATQIWKVEFPFLPSDLEQMRTLPQATLDQPWKTAEMCIRDRPDGTWGCYVNFYMRIDGDEWDEMWDTLPPRYEEYKATLAG